MSLSAHRIEKPIESISQCYSSQPQCVAGSIENHTGHQYERLGNKLLCLCTLQPGSRRRGSTTLVTRESAVFCSLLSGIIGCLCKKRRSDASDRAGDACSRKAHACAEGRRGRDWRLRSTVAPPYRITAISSCLVFPGFLSFDNGFTGQRIFLPAFFPPTLKPEVDQGPDLAWSVYHLFGFSPL